MSMCCILYNQQAVFLGNGKDSIKIYGVTAIMDHDYGLSTLGNRRLNSFRIDT